MTGDLGDVTGLSSTDLARDFAVRVAMAQDKPDVMPAPVFSEIDTGAEDRRGVALRAARQASSEAKRFGGRARLVLWRNEDGSTNLKPPDPDRPKETNATVCYDDQPVIVGTARIWSDAEDLAFHERVRRADNVALAAVYALDELVAAGILTADEAADPEVAAAAGKRPKLRRPAPYSMTNSVA